MGVTDIVTNDRQDGRFDAILRAATDYSIIGVDLAGTITVFNSGAERMLGYRADELVGRATPVVFHDMAEIEARAAELGIEPGFDVFVQTARAGGSETREWTYVRRDGSVLPVSLTVTAIRGDGGGPTGFLGIARDLTADREARAQLVRSVQRFAAVFEANPIPTLITRLADGLILMANSASLSVLGWSADEFIGRSVADVGLWASPEQRQDLVERLRAEGRVREVAVDIRRRDGAIRQALGTVELLELDGERCLIAIFQDVTENMRLQAAVRESEARLVAFLDHAPALVLIKGADGRFQVVNRRFVEAFGIPAEDVIGRTTSAPSLCRSRRSGPLSAGASRRAASTPASLSSPPARARRSAAASWLHGTAPSPLPSGRRIPTRAVSRPRRRTSTRSWRSSDWRRAPDVRRRRAR